MFLLKPDPESWCHSDDEIYPWFYYSYYSLQHKSFYLWCAASICFQDQNFQCVLYRSSGQKPLSFPACKSQN